VLGPIPLHPGKSRTHKFDWGDRKHLIRTFPHQWGWRIHSLWLTVMSYILLRTAGDGSAAPGWAPERTGVSGF
jgi:hypothetical protein